MELPILIEQIEEQERQKAEIAEEIKAIYDQAKTAGYNIKAIKRLIKERKQNPDEVEEEEKKYQQYKKELKQLNLFEQAAADNTAETKVVQAKVTSIEEKEPISLEP